MVVATRTWAEPVAGPGGSPQLGCDLPLDLRPVIAHNELFLGGWAVAIGDEIAAVEVESASRKLLASYGHPSPWLESEFEGASFARYELKIDTSQLPRGRHELRVRAIAARGGRAEMRGALECEPYRPTPWRHEDQEAAVLSGDPAIWVESPNLFGEHQAYPPIILRGWAHAGSGITSVVAFIEGERYEGSIGRARPDLQARFGAAVAESGGFLIPLTGLEQEPGPHEVTVIAYPGEGAPVGMSGQVHVETVAKAWVPASVPKDDDSRLADQRYVPQRDRGTSIEIEHEARYRWAAELVGGKRVLDAGCGTGWGSALLARAGAASVTGVDLNELAIGHARDTYGDRAEFQLADLCSLELEDCEFDLVVCFEAIEHVEDASSALDHLRRMLRPEGLLLVSSPVAGVYPPGNPFHVYEFAAGELEQALRRRFERVRAFRQHTHAATLLADDGVMAVRNPRHGLNLDARKTVSVAPGEETYTVVAASDADLPDAPRIAVFGEALDIRELKDELQQATAEVDAARGKASFSEMHVVLMRNLVETLETKLASVKGQLEVAERERALNAERLTGVLDSRSWRWSEPVRSGVRSLRSRAAHRKKP